MQSGVCSASAGERDSYSSIAEQQAVTPDTSFNGVAKRMKGPEVGGRIDRHIRGFRHRPWKHPCIDG